VIRDITNRKRAEEELREAALFPEQNPSPVLRVRRDGLLLFANSAAASLLAASLCAWESRPPKPFAAWWMRRLPKA